MKPGEGFAVSDCATCRLLRHKRKPISALYWTSTVRGSACSQAHTLSHPAVSRKQRSLTYIHTPASVAGPPGLPLVHWPPPPQRVEPVDCTSRITCTFLRYKARSQSRQYGSKDSPCEACRLGRLPVQTILGSCRPRDSCREAEVYSYFRHLS